MRLSDFLLRLRSDPIAAAGRGLARAQSNFETAREATMAKAESARVAGIKLKERATAKFNEAADSVEAAQRAERVAARIRDILS